MKLQRVVIEIPVQPDVDEAFGFRPVTGCPPREEHLATAANPVLAVDGQIPAAIPVVIEAKAAAVLPCDQVRIRMIAGNRDPGLQIFGLGQRLEDAARVGADRDIAWRCSAALNPLVGGAKILG